MIYTLLFFHFRLQIGENNWFKDKFPYCMNLGDTVDNKKDHIAVNW